MTKINPLLYITDWSPIPETALNASDWFEDETSIVVIRAGSEESLGWFLAQGWVVVNSTRAQAIQPRVYNSDGSYFPGGVVGYDFTYQLKRRKLQSERVLQSMINEFTKAYNEGRELNDLRYDEIITLQSVMLDDSENEFVTLNTSSDAYEAIVDQVIADMSTDFTTYQGEVEGIYDSWGTSQRERIATQFDNQLEQAKADLISRGMYNSTVWTSTSAAIEENRAKALNELEDRIVDKRFSLSDRINTVREGLRSRLEASALRLSGEKQKRVIGQLEFRNAIITALTAFMERRSDDYPGIAELAKLAAGLGYSEGGTVRA
jgi:hypothetical protein